MHLARRRVSWLAALGVLLGLAGVGRAQTGEPYVRVTTRGREDAALQTAVATFRRPGSSVEVVLYGVVHVADAAYYGRVQRDLDSYTEVLYEGVAPGSEQPTESERSLGELQRLMGDLLGLSFQKDGIDYTRPNLVHADMNMDQLRAALGGGGISPFGNMMDERQVEMLVPVLRMMAGFGRMFLDSDPRMRDQLKMQLATQLSQADMQQGLGERAHQAILIDRNTVALEVLRRELERNDRGSLAIFYGAAHMPDLEQRLGAMGFALVSKRWMSAWQIGDGVADDAHEPGPSLVLDRPAPVPVPTGGRRWF